jgi:hypothetical protein
MRVLVAITVLGVSLALGWARAHSVDDLASKGGGYVDVLCKCEEGNPTAACTGCTSGTRGTCVCDTDTAECTAQAPVSICAQTITTGPCVENSSEVNSTEPCYRTYECKTVDGSPCGTGNGCEWRQTGASGNTITTVQILPDPSCKSQ